MMEAMIVMDGERQLVYANRAAYELLGFREGETIQGRCRETTRGMDCSIACPLSDALRSPKKGVKDFQTSYLRRDGKPVALKVTIVPLRDADGNFSGAVEILRPNRLDLGFYLSGDSPASEAARLSVLSMADGDLLLVGEEAPCCDLALSLHRLRGCPDDLFRAADQDDGRTWPPRTVFGIGVAAAEKLKTKAAPGIRRIVSISRQEHEGLAENSPVFVLPLLKEMATDLPVILLEWAKRVVPGIEITRPALNRLVDLAISSGIEAAGSAMKQGLALASGKLEEKDLPLSDRCFPALKKFMLAEDPLKALEARFLEEMLLCHEWRIQDVASRLRMSRVTLWRKMKDYGIERKTSQAPSGGE